MVDAETPAERRLRDPSSTGEVVVLDDLDEDARVIRAQFLRAVVVAAGRRDPRGLRVQGARVDGPLDLAFVTCGWPLSFAATVFEREITIEHARLPGFELKRCEFPGLRGREAVVASDVVLDGSTVSGRVSLDGAVITGRLSCVGTTIINRGGRALVLDGAQIAAVFLTDEFRTIGEVRAQDSSIRTVLNCGGATLENPGGDALSLDRAEISGSVFLTPGFHAKGAVRALDLSMRGVLDCAGATLENPGGDALSLDRAEISGGVLLTPDFRAKGTVRALDATIKGQLDCAGAVLEKRDGVALYLDRTEIGDILLEAFQATGEVRARTATIKKQLVCAGATLTNPDGDALLLAEAVVGGGVLLTEGFRSQGAVRAPRLEAGGDFVCSEAKLANEGDLALNLRDARLTGLIFQASTVWGGIDLYRARVVTLADDLKPGSLGSWSGAAPMILDGFSYARFGDHATWTSSPRHRWLEQTSEFQPAPWTQLIQVYRAHGFDEDAVRTGIAMQNDRLRRARLRRHQKIGRWVLRVTIAHGYRPSLAIAWAVGVVGAFTAVVWQTEPGHFTPATDVTGSPEPVVYAADKFLPIVDFGQASRWTANGWVSWVEWTVVLLGWILSTIVVAGFTRIVRTT
jgi:hypothetical protein